MIFSFIILLIQLAYITYPHMRLLFFIYEPYVGGINIGNTTYEQIIVSIHPPIYPVANATIVQNPNNTCLTQQLMM
jgi:hypothetical protein